MKNTTPFGAVATRFCRIVDRIDQFAFREPDLRAVARGWQVRRDGPFSRIYRDPRWDEGASADESCHGAGMPAATCPDCGGVRTLRRPFPEKVPSR